MNPVWTYAVAAFLGLVAVAALVGTRLPVVGEAARVGIRVGHGATALVVLLDVLTLLDGHRVDSRTTHIGYAVAAVGLPVVLLTRQGEDAEPPHLGVVAVTAAAMAVLVVRLQQTW